MRENLDIDLDELSVYDDKSSYVDRISSAKVSDRRSLGGMIRSGSHSAFMKGKPATLSEANLAELNSRSGGRGPPVQRSLVVSSKGSRPRSSHTYTT